MRDGFGEGIRTELPADVVCNLSKECQIARAILGCEFDGLLEYFVTIFSMCAAWEKQKRPYYIACITRRCYVLVIIFTDLMRSNWQRLFPVFQDTYFKEETAESSWRKIEYCIQEHFLTDTALSLMCAKIAQELSESSPFEVVVLDELLIHGRSINLLLYRLQKNIEHLQKGDGHKKKQEFLDHVRVCIYARNNDMVLLNSNYEQHVIAWKICVPEEWRELSLRLAKLVSVFDVNNVAYSWGFRRIQPRQTEEQNAGAFQRIQTDLYNVNMESFLWFYPSREEPKAICTVRRRNGRISGRVSEEQQLLVPYTIVDRWDLNDVLALHRKIVSDLENEQMPKSVITMMTAYDVIIEEQDGIDKDIYYRRISETNELVINALVMMRYFKSMEGDVPSFQSLCDQLNTEQLSRNYRTTDLTAQETADALMALWNMKDYPHRLEGYLDLLLRNVPPLPRNCTRFGHGEQLVDWEDSTSKGSKWKNFVVYGTEDAIADIGYEMERNGYVNSSGKVFLSIDTLSNSGKTQTLTSILSKASNYIGEYLNPADRYASLAQVMAVILHTLDYGMISIHPYFSTNNRRVQKDTVSCGLEFRACETSLLIFPIRYRNFNKVMSVLSWNKDDFGSVEIKIRDFVSRMEAKSRVELCEEHNLSRELMRYYKMTIWCGQKFSEFQFIPEVLWDESYRCADKMSSEELSDNAFQDDRRRFEYYRAFL